MSLTLFVLAAAAQAGIALPPEPETVLVQPPTPPLPVVATMPSPLPQSPLSKRRMATPRVNPGLWVTTSDYPVNALRTGLEGYVGFRLSISRSGQVNGCEVTSSSASAELDEATCRLIAARARFNPAQDDKGEPTGATYSSRVRWTIPKGGMPPVAGSFHIAFTVEKDGSQSDCRVIQSSGTGGRSPAGPIACRPGRIAPAFSDAQGNPVRKRVTITESTTIEDLKD